MGIEKAKTAKESVVTTLKPKIDVRFGKRKIGLACGEMETELRDKATCDLTGLTGIKRNGKERSL